MSYIKKNKYHLAGITLLSLLFLVSIQVRKESLEAPLSRHHEWITAHTLITSEIWSQNGGPSAFGFNPVYSYPGKGNKSKRMLGGVTAKNGDDYYVSYPPFAFYLAYYTNQFIGGSAVTNIRILTLLIHYICVLLIYFIIRQISSDYGKDKFQIAGVFAGVVYIFSTANLWIHGNLYFADMVEQALFFACLLLIIRFFKKEYKDLRSSLILIGIFFFLATYTEWLGVFISFYTGLSLLVLYFITKEKEKLKAFLVIALCSGLALTTVIWQYSNIVDFETFKEASLTKYDQRSGHLDEEETNNVFNMHSKHSYLAIERYMGKGYKMGENFIGIAAILLIVALAFRRTREQMKKVKWKLVIFILVFISILTHYLAFFNFNSIHDFSTLKTGGFLILTTALIILSIEESLNNKLKYVLAGIFGILLILKVPESIERYHDHYPMSKVDYDRVESAYKIRQFSTPDAGVYTNVRLSPEQVYYAKHNIFPLKDTSYVKHFMNMFQDDRVQYYHHEGSKLKYMLEYQRVDSDNIVIVDKLHFNMESSDENVHHSQK